ncbi:hypothetical protein LEP1GSC170_1052 [Leptospira interrogans serovar Bataviae str. HAI135]|nr:hypothetical protein LEP1GSC170_1052 [Leptospira interrogans serovar Bataviae str. HAI135]
MSIIEKESIFFPDLEFFELESLFEEFLDFGSKSLERKKCKY